MMTLLMLIGCIASEEQQDACAAVCESSGAIYERCEKVPGGVRCTCLFLSPIPLDLTPLDPASGG